MKTNNNLAAYSEDLSMLTLSEEARTNAAHDLDKILSSLQMISALDLCPDTPECVSPLSDTGNTIAFRADEVKPSYERESILKNAPVRNDEFFLAPKTVD
jgi:aspartyl-tRNA(Asn)/glutamyl-tRNA(Gln) amidotransferase subunit C